MVGRGRKGLSLDVVRECLFMIPVLILTVEVEAVIGLKAAKMRLPGEGVCSEFCL